MFKNKTIKLFLILGVIFFSLVGVVGCSNPTGSNSINATYIRTHFEEDDIDGQFEIINNHIDLITLLENNIPEKYDDKFFETKSLLVFKIVESSGGNKSEIESYRINDKVLNVYVKTKQYGDSADMGYWWFILELNKKEVETFENVKILKNGEEIMSGGKQNIYAYSLEASDNDAANKIEDIFSGKTNIKIGTIYEPKENTSCDNDVEEFKRIKEEMNKLGFDSLKEYQEYLEFKKMKQMGA